MLSLQKKTQCIAALRDVHSKSQQRISKVEVVRRCEKILSMGYVPMSQCPGAMVCVGALQWRSVGVV